MPRRNSSETDWPKAYRHARQRAVVVDWSVIGALVIILAILSGILGGGFLWWKWNFGTERTITCTVTDKDRTSNHDGKSVMRVYTDQCGTLQVKDNWAHGLLRSADLYGSLDAGHTYQLKTIGWRNGWLSTFPDVIEATEVSG